MTLLERLDMHLERIKNNPARRRFDEWEVLLCPLQSRGAEDVVVCLMNDYTKPACAFYNPETDECFVVDGIRALMKIVGGSGDGDR